MCKSRLFRSCLVALLLMLGWTASAKTPDGVTPAKEDVCDGLKGRGNLYGLCVAYCEAHDSDMATSNSRAGRGSSVRAERLLANYVKSRQSVDPELPPCLTVTSSPPAPDPIPVPPPVVQTCPCWTPAQADAIDGVLSNLSTAFGWPAPTNSGAACGTDPRFPYMAEEGSVDGLRERTLIQVVDLDSPAMHYCHYQTELKGAIDLDTLKVLHVSEGALTLEQLADCKADLLARQAALGLCQPTP